MMIYDQAKAEVEAEDIVLALSDLQYISSAGLRVLLIMKKALNGGEVKCLNTSNAIMEIFETTGFSEIFKF